MKWFFTFVRVRRCFVRALSAAFAASLVLDKVILFSN
jgi:hypothetical protein